MRTSSGAATRASRLILVCGALYALLGPAVAGAATLTVNTTVDQAGAGAECALREAITAANTNSNFGGCTGSGPFGDDTIPLGDGTFKVEIGGATESANASGDLDVLDGAGSLTISHSGIGAAAIDGGGLDRVIDVFGTLDLSGVTIQGGNTNQNAGGIFNFGGTLIISNSTISGNVSDSFGGGINSSGTTVLTNVTLSGNSATGGGGGIEVQNGNVTLNSVTVTGNVADANGSGGAFDDGGGVRPEAGTDSFTLHNTIVAGNTDGTVGNPAPDCMVIAPATISSAGGNVVGSTVGCSFGPGGTDIANVNAMLGPLADNGGGMFTHALLVGGPAIDRATGCPATDQRGVPRPPGCDSGAYELVSCKGVVVNRVGTQGNDLVTGTAGPDALLGLGGNDTLLALAGSDTACGGSGKDKEVGGPGNDRLLGEAGRDRLLGGVGKDNLNGGVGRDKLLGGAGRDTMKGGKGRDLCKGGAKKDAAKGCERERGIP